MKILAVCGSPRLRGNSNYLADKALQAAADLGVATEKVVLSRYQVSPCVACRNCEKLKTCSWNDDGNWILEKLAAADGIILATPVYFYNVSAQMKTLIDRCHFFYSHGIKPKAKTLGFIVTAGEYGIADTLHALYRYNEVTFNIPESHIFSVSGIALAPGAARRNKTLVEAALNLGRRMAHFLNK